MRKLPLVLIAAAIAGYAADTALIQSKSAGVSGCAPATSASGAENVEWWKKFKDDELNKLMDRALSSSLNLRLAQTRILEARAAAYQTKADSRPVISQQDSLLHGSGAPTSTSSTVSKLIGNTSGSNDYDNRQAGLKIAWERDLFGVTRNNLKASNLDTTAAQEDRHSVQVALLADIAAAYVQLRGYQEQIEFIHQSEAVWRDNLQLAKSRFDAGLESDYAVTQATLEIANAEAQTPPLEAAIQSSAHHLAVLSGEEPKALLQELAASQPVPDEPPDVPSGLPSDLLRRRPDVRKAECTLEAVAARKAAARAERFPQFSLTGSFGSHEQTFSALSLAGGGRFFSIGPSITVPILSGGRIRAAIQTQTAREQEAAVELQQAVLTSLEDVENALANRSHDRQRQRLLEESVALNQRKLELANQLYAAGVQDFGPVLDAQQTLIALKTQLADTRRSLVADVIGLYRALGGGWK